MSGSSVLLDSNVIILASKGQIDVVSLVSQFDNFFVSIVTFMEVYGYQFEDEEEKKAVDALFSQLQIVEVNLPIAQKVVEYRSKPHKKNQNTRCHHIGNRICYGFCAIDGRLGRF